MWVEIAVTATLFQTARNALARSLSGRVPPMVNSWSRFAFNLPFSAALMVALVWLHGAPALPPGFFLFCLGTALSQLLANVALVAAFERATFAESIMLHKLEVVFAALVGVAFFAEAPTALGWAGVLTCGVGVLALNLGSARGPEGWRRAFHLDLGAMLALTCGLLLVLASFWLKEATGVFAAANPRVGAGRFEAAAHTVFHTTWMEVAILSAAIAVRGHPLRELVRRHGRRMAAIGATSFAGSLCWFWAYSLTLVAYVKAVGQLEGVLAVALGLVVWREREVWRQLPGVGLLLAGIVMVLLG